MFSFMILVIGARIEIEIMMDRRPSSWCACTIEDEIGWCEHEISAHEMGQHKIESDTLSESTRDIDEPPPILHQVYLGCIQT